MIVVKSSSKSWCYCWDYEGIGDIVLSYIWRGSCRPMDKTHVEMWIWFTWLGMWHRGSVVLQVAPQPREPSDGFCGLKLAGWESCNSYYLSWSPGHILGAKKSAWLNGSHLMLLAWSQANVLKRGPLSHLYPLLNPLLSINCLEAAQPRAIVASLLSGLVDTSWELPCHLCCFGHCLGVFDPFLLLEAFSLNWGTPHSLEFPPFYATSFLTLWLTFFYFICISWDFSQFCLRPLFFLDNPIYGLGFQCPWHHWFSNRGRAVKNVRRCTSYHQHSLSYWSFWGMVVPQLYM